MQSGDKNPVYEELASTFSGAGLAVPPVPSSLRGRLIRQDDWLYGTERVSRDSLYFASFPAIELASKPDALALGHGGHGVNSYAVTYVLGFRAIGVFIQVLWGGAYMDSQQQAEELSARFERIAELIARASVPDAGRRRLLALHSSFRGSPSAFGWLEDGAPFTEGWTHEHQVREDPLDLALQAFL